MSLPKPTPPVRRIEIAGHSALEIGAPEDPIELVFSHANGFHAALYQSLLAPLAVGRRIIAPDLRGHGRTRLPADPARLRSWERFGKDLTRIIDALEAPPLVLAGHSMGAAASLLAAAARPGKVRRLALIEPVFGPPFYHKVMRLTPFRALWRRTFPLAKSAARRRADFDSIEAAFEAYHGRGAFRTWPDASLRAYVEGGMMPAEGGGVRLACAPAWEAACFSAPGADIWGALERARVPIVMRAGEHHSTVYPRPLAHALRLRPDIDFARVPGTTHFLPQEDPAAARAAIEAVLKGAPTG